MSWLKTGNESAAIAQQEQQEAALRKKAMGHLYRFHLKQGEEARITFVDGGLNETGHLIPPRFYEHSVQVAGKWENFVCPEKTDPNSGDKCPLCAAGDKPYLAAVFTIIDHREIKSTKDASKSYKDMPRLLVAKPTAFDLIAHKAKKYGGLAGVTFDVARLGEKASGIGDNFDFIERTDRAELEARFTRTVKDAKGVETVETSFKEADYSKEIMFRTGDELRALGLGVATAASPTYKPSSTVVGAGEYKPPSQQLNASSEAQTDYSGEL